MTDSVIDLDLLGTRVKRDRLETGTHTEEHVAVECTLGVSKERADCYHLKNWIVGTRMDGKGLRGKIHYKQYSFRILHDIDIFLLKIIEFLVGRLI